MTLDSYNSFNVKLLFLEYRDRLIPAKDTSSSEVLSHGVLVSQSPGLQVHVRSLLLLLVNVVTCRERMEKVVNNGFPMMVVVLVRFSKKYVYVKLRQN